MAKTRAKVSINGSRERAKARIRRRVVGSVERPRVSIFRSGKHTYAQVICDTSQKTLAAASTLDADVKAAVTKLVAKAEDKKKTSLKSVLAAKAVGLVLAERSRKKNVSQVVFDRNGFLYAGRVKALADGAREGGLTF